MKKTLVSALTTALVVGAASTTFAAAYNGPAVKTTLKIF